MEVKVEAQAKHDPTPLRDLGLSLVCFACFRHHETTVLQPPGPQLHVRSRVARS